VAKQYNLFLVEETMHEKEKENFQENSPKYGMK